MKRKAVAAVSAAVLTAGLGISAAQWASAETPTPSPTPTSTTTADPDHTGHKGGKQRGSKQDLSGLASKLGVDQTKLADAVSAARKSLPTKTESANQTDAEREAARAARQAAYAKALASELGIDEAKVTQALNELRTERQAARTAADKAVLDQAVRDGKLTQAEADAVQKAADQGIVRIGGHGRGR
ncbi:MAG: hypothetical protein VB036_12555 [Propionicimonas sp.]|nr:hypothetical protein [Propionicimonas sp.]